MACSNLFIPCRNIMQKHYFFKSLTWNDYNVLLCNLHEAASKARIHFVSHGHQCLFRDFLYQQQFLSCLHRLYIGWWFIDGFAHNKMCLIISQSICLYGPHNTFFSGLGNMALFRLFILTTYLLQWFPEVLLWFCGPYLKGMLLFFFIVVEKMLCPITIQFLLP